MESQSSDFTSDGDRSKEEGEITDDEEIDRALVYNRGSRIRGRERAQHATRNARFPRENDGDRRTHGISLRFEEERRNHSSVSRYEDDSTSRRYNPFRDVRESRRPLPEPSRFERSPERTSFRKEQYTTTSYGRLSLGNQRDRQYQQSSRESDSCFTPSSSKLWRQKFCPTSLKKSELARESSRQVSSNVTSTHPDIARTDSSVQLQFQYEKLLEEHRRIKEQLKAYEGSNTPLPHGHLLADKSKGSNPCCPVELNPAETVEESVKFILGDKVEDVHIQVKEEKFEDVSSAESDVTSIHSFGDLQEATVKKETLPLVVSSLCTMDIVCDHTVENERSCRVLAGDSINVENSVDVRDVPSNIVIKSETKTLTADTSNETSSVVLLSSPRAVICTSADEVVTETAISSVGTAEIEQVLEEDDDLDELELRRIALASAAARTRTNDDTDSTNNLHSHRVQLCASQNFSSPISLTTNISSSPSSHIELLPVKSSKTCSQTTTTKSEHISRRTKTSSKEKTGKTASNGTDASGDRSLRNATTQKAGRRSSSGVVREKSVPPKRRRPLPFAPVRLDKITISPLSKTGSLNEAVQRAQRRARASVVRHVSKSSASSKSSLSHRDGRKRSKVTSDQRKSREDIERKEEERRRKITEILSLEDPKRQVEMFLRFLKGATDGSSRAKQQQLSDNYEEVEMDIDSTDETTDDLQLDDFKSAMQPIPFVGSEIVHDYGLNEMLQRTGYWLAPYNPIHLYSHLMTVVQPPPPPQPLLPPLPDEDIPKPPPPPPPDPSTPLTSVLAEKQVDIRNVHESPNPLVRQNDQISQNCPDEAFIRKENAQELIPHLLDNNQHSTNSDWASENQFDSESTEQFDTFLRDQQDAAVEDEDEAELLRAQLLKSLAVKKRLELCESSKPSSAESSPSVSVTQSPQRTVVNSSKVTSRLVTVHRQKNYQMLPIHKPVVVPLGASSSEDEEENQINIHPSGAKCDKTLVSVFDIDSFLKAQRKTVEAQSKILLGKEKEVKQQSVPDVQQLRLQQEQNLQKQELELAKQRQAIISDQTLLKQVLTKTSRFLAESKKAEFKAAQLREQLLAAERLAMATMEQVQRAKVQARDVRDLLLKKKQLYKQSEDKVLCLGRLLFGYDYQPPVTRSLGLKRKVEVVHRGPGITVTLPVNASVAAKKKKLNSKLMKLGNQENNPSSNFLQQASLARAQEKARLQKLADEYEEKIRILKMMQAQKIGQASVISGASVDTKPLLDKKAPVSDQTEARLPSLENIKLEPIDSEDESQKKVRRRSLLDLIQSPKPTLLLKDCRNVQETEKGLSTTELSSPYKSKQRKINFNMPTGSQFRNLCKIQREKVEKILTTRSEAFSDVFSNLLPQCEPITELKVAPLGKRSADYNYESKSETKLPYTSQLLTFRAYRFSPYYRTKEGLTIPSASFSHKLNANRILCRYDLQGTCNDQQCTWQHARDYRLSDRELLEDLVSYCPRLAGVTDNTPVEEYSKIIGSYVEGLLTQHKGKMKTEDLCLLLTARVTESANHVRPHTMFYESRAWKPSAGESQTFSLSVTSQFQTPLSASDGFVKNVREVDTVLDVEDVRYFVSDSGAEVQDMEGAVLATPDDTDLWLRLAYSKLSNPVRSGEECLEQALNVLSRGLETNKTSSDLWAHYLTLYRCHDSAASDFVDLCNSALHYAPSYDIWWQLLEACVSFHLKDNVCDRTLQFLCTDSEGSNTKTSAELRSHQVLEMLLYKVTVCVQSGRFKTALNFLQGVLGVRECRDKENQYLKKLTCADTSVLWICLVYLMEFHTLPAALYDPANQNPGQIVSKERLYIPWHSKQDLFNPLETLVQYLGLAATPDPSQITDPSSASQYVQAVYNLAGLLRHYKKYEEACGVIQKFLEIAPHVDDVWLMAADIYAGCNDSDNAKKVFMDAVEFNTYSAKLHYHFAVMEITQGCNDEALELMEQFVISYFDVTPKDLANVDPNFLFCKLLGLDVPHRKWLPQVREDVKPLLMTKNVYLWLCYCLLLDLQGETSEAVEAFELALSSTTCAADLCQLWKSYVQFLHRRYQTCSQATAPAILQQLQEAMMHSITTAPTLVPVPFPRQHKLRQQQHWNDLSHVNSLVEFYLGLMPPDGMAPALHTYCDLMPGNVHLLIRCVEMALADGQMQRAYSLCTAAVYDKMANLHLWKLALAIAQVEGTPKEVERLFIRAVRALPLSMTLWKDFLLFEVSQANTMAVETILSQCQVLGLNIHGYVATISSTS